MRRTNVVWAEKEGAQFGLRPPWRRLAMPSGRPTMQAAASWPLVDHSNCRVLPRRAEKVLAYANMDSRMIKRLHSVIADGAGRYEVPWTTNHQPYFKLPALSRLCATLLERD